jgi:HAD superfamily hydrolase (TIGR01509 family)
MPSTNALALAGMFIFDLDGTLTVPTLDFDAIRAEIGLPPGPILESLERLSAVERAAAAVILERHERLAAEESRLYPGAGETVAALRRAGWPVAVLTRNARRWAEVVFRKHNLVIDGLHTREDGAFKPSPDPVLRLCAAFERSPAASWMVGDHHFDLTSGRTAGCRTVLMLGDRPRPDYADEADHVITDLGELLALSETARTSPNASA